MRRRLLVVRLLVLGAAALIGGCASWDRDNRPLPAVPNSPPAVVWKSAKASDNPDANQVRQATALQVEPKGAPKPPAPLPFQFPSGLPGADTPPITLPSLKGLTPEERERKVRELFPALPPLPEEPKAELPPKGAPLTLAELQELALRQNPVIRRAAADVDVAYGNMVQAGLPPNPHVGYQADQIMPGHKPTNNAGQQGAFIQQLFKTAGKLSLARAAAGMALANAEVALRRSRIDVVTQVRTAYFSVLVARETLRVSRTLAELADQVYGLQLKLLATGEFAGYEPLQLYAQAVYARNAHLQANNRHLAAWRQLAAALGTPDLPPQALGGGADAAVPAYEYESAIARVLAVHTDVLTAMNTILQYQYDLRLAQVTPYPDVQAGTAIQHDNATSNNQANVQVGIALPLFDRNQGNIRAARAQLARSHEDLRVRRNDLAGRLGEAFGRYRSSRSLVENYRERVLPNLSRAYRAIYQRYQQEHSAVGFAEIVVAQQQYTQALGAYLTALGDQWTAVVDLANLLQIDDIYQPLEVIPGEERKEKD
jgi:cobalt-zinc-cadmium efflux system outer membrane protein